MFAYAEHMNYVKELSEFLNEIFCYFIYSAVMHTIHNWEIAWIRGTHTVCVRFDGGDDDATENRMSFKNERDSAVSE